MTGYRRGAKHGVSVGTKQVEFSTYCAKAFAAIGSIARDLESRCLICLLGYGVPARSWTDEVLTRDAEANQMLAALATVLPSAASIAWVAPSFLQGREKEIGTPIWSVALALGLDAATMERVKAGLLDWFQWKADQGGERKAYRDLIVGKVDDGATRRALEVQALRDLASVLPIADSRVSGDIASVRAVELMAEANRSWVRFGGLGLDAVGLSALLLPFGLKPEPVRLTKSAGKQVRGYKASKVRKALAIVEGV